MYGPYTTCLGWVDLQQMTASLLSNAIYDFPKFSGISLILGGRDAKYPLLHLLLKLGSQTRTCLKAHRCAQMTKALHMTLITSHYDQNTNQVHMY